MNTFFDMREFFIVILKKMKFCIMLTALCVIGGILIRFIPLIIEYATFQEPNLEATQQATDEFPYKYQARRTLYLEPQYENIDGVVIDKISTIANAYLACYQNKEILQPLVDKYYTEAAKDFLQYNERLVAYNYSTRTILEEVYTPTKFYGIVTIKTVGNTEVSTGNYVNIYATTGNEELSERIATDAEKLISSYISELVGDYTYTITEGQIGQQTPQASAGLIPKSLSNNTISTVKRLELPYIIKRSVKGGVWGLVGGLGMSIVLCFLFHCMSLNLTTEADLKSYSVPVLTSVKLKNKKYFLGFINKWIDILEGNNQNCDSYEQAAKLASAYIHTMETAPSGNIVLTGAGDMKEMQKFGELLQEIESTYNVSISTTITLSAKTVEKVSEALGIILFESLGHSNKQEIQKEIDQITLLGKRIYGIVLEK